MRSIQTLLATSTLFVVTSTGCATVLKSKEATISVTSATPGAEVLVDGVAAGQTPTELKLSQKEDAVITIQQDGKKETCTLESGVSGTWIAIDIITGGLGWLVDWGTHNWNSLDKTKCHATL